MAKRRGGTARNRAVSSNRSTSGMIPVICSDCYFEMMYDPASAGDEIVCPSCGHVCDRPDEGQIHRVHHHAKKATMSYLAGAVLLSLAIVGAFFFFYTRGNPHLADDALGKFGPLAAMAIGIFGFVGLSFKHDSDRVEAYF